MPARFQVKQSFAIERRHVFVLVGTPVEGAVTAGMQAVVRVSDALSLTIPIHGIETVRRGGAESVALTSRYTGPEELELLRGLDLGGSLVEIAEIVEVAEEDAAAGPAGEASPELPVACALSPPALRERREGALRALRAQAEEIREIRGGYSLRFPAGDALLDDLVKVIQMERKCCAFLRFSLVVTPGEGPIWLELTGPEGTQELLTDILEISALTP